MPLIRTGVASVLRDGRVTVVGESGASLDADGLVRGTHADLLVIGRSDDADPADVITRVRAQQPAVAVVALFAGSTREELLAVVDAGADAVVPQCVERDELLEAIESIGHRQRYLSPALTPMLFAATGLDDDARDHPSGGLTSRERAIVRFLADGHTNGEIGEELFISRSTVKTHLSHVYEKLGARNRYDAVVKATQLAIL